MRIIAAHLRSNLISYLALFVALGGTSYAAVKLPTNSVGSKQLRANSVTSGKVKNGTLLARDFKSGQLPAGLQGVQGIQGSKGEKGDPGQDGAPATRLWGRVNTFPATPALLDQSGVVAIQRDAGFPGTDGIFLITFDRDVNHCAFVATPVLRGGGAAIPTPAVAVNTGFYQGSGTTSQQIRVTTFLNGARANIDFDFAAIC
jgi:hypothetical protein